MASEQFRPRERICRRLDFLRVYREGQRVHRRGFVLHCAFNGLEFDRLGLAVSRRVGCAVVRNRAKRRLRELFRRNKSRSRVGVDMVFSAKPQLAVLSFPEIEREYRGAVSEARRRLARRGSRRGSLSAPSASIS
jgi:ribonuclease P protein component